MAETKSKKSTPKKATTKKRPPAPKVTYDDLLAARRTLEAAEADLVNARGRYRRAQAQDEILRKQAMLAEETPKLAAAQAAVGKAHRDFYELSNKARKETPDG